MKNLILNGLALFIPKKSEGRSKATRGFTLIELLIVIALIGILAVALLSAINPLEQLRKGRDSARKADASELLNAIERFNASYQCYPWNYDIAGGACVASGFYVNLLEGVEPSFAAGGNVEDLLVPSGEVKTEFTTRVDTTSTAGPSASKIFMAEIGGSTNIEGVVKTCFEPESNTGRTGGLGRVQNNGISSAVPTYANCIVTYTGGTVYAAGCNICLPQ